MEFSVGDPVRLDPAFRWVSRAIYPHIGQVGRIVSVVDPGNRVLCVRFPDRGGPELPTARMIPPGDFDKIRLRAPTWWFLRSKYLTHHET